jgi:hypothetical protein
MEAKKSADDILPWVVGIGGLLAGVGIGYFLVPELSKLLGFTKKEEAKQVVVLKQPNPHPNPESEQETRSFSQPHYTRGLGPRLQARYAHSGTDFDLQTLDQRARDAEIVAEADARQAEAVAGYVRRGVNLSVPTDRRMTYGSDGHGGVVPVQNLSRRWEVVVGE